MEGMLERLTIRVLVDDAAGQDSVLRAQHGLSLLLEGESSEGMVRILLDVGQCFETLRDNMAWLGVAPTSIDALVLSHGHYDHTRGMAALVAATGKTLPVVAHPGVFRPRMVLSPGPRSIGVVPEDGPEALERAGGVLFLSEDPVPLGPGMGTTGYVPRRTDFESSSLRSFTVGDGHLRVDDLEDDLAVALLVRGRGVVVATGCSHAGIVNVVRRALELFPGEALDGVVGGFHLGSASEDRIVRTAEALGEMKPRWIAPGHCTGFVAQSIFQKFFGEAFVRPWTGMGFVVAPGEDFKPSRGA